MIGKFLRKVIDFDFELQHSLREIKDDLERLKNPIIGEYFNVKRNEWFFITKKDIKDRVGDLIKINLSIYYDESVWTNKKYVIFYNDISKQKLTIEKEFNKTVKIER